jgi:hypothetical protein
MRQFTLILLSVLMPVSGCVNPYGRRSVAQVAPGIAPSELKVCYESTYALFRTDELGAAIYSTHLMRGERVGFRRECDGSLVAVASCQLIPLSEGTYVWKVVPGTAPTLRERALKHWHQFGTGMHGVLIVAGLAVVGCAIVAIWFVYKSKVPDQ